MAIGWRAMTIHMMFSPNGVLFRGKGKKLLKLLGKANSFLFAQKNAQFYYDMDLD